MDNAEKNVSDFYNTVGWESKDGTTEDSRRWEDHRAHSREYVHKCRLRVLEQIPDSGGDNILDMASGPIQYEEYLEYSKNFTKRYCVDYSSDALKAAKERIGDHGEFLCGNFFEFPLDEDFFDCTISLHTVYHIDEAQQEDAIRRMIHVTKPGKPVIVVYSNPTTLLGTIWDSFPIRVLKRIKKLVRKPEEKTESEKASELYFVRHPIDWWQRFSDVADVEILPWRSFHAGTMKRGFPDNTLGSAMFALLYRLEERFPTFFARQFQYPMIVMTKKEIA